MKRALITGIFGQDASYLAEYLLSLGYDVYGTVRRGSAVWSIPPGKVLYADMRDEASLKSALMKVWPDEIYNLAAQSFPWGSWHCSAETFDVNVGGVARLLELVERIKPDTRIFQASTADSYGLQEGAVNDQTPMRPMSPYGVSKLAAHKLMQLYRERGLYTACGILFNHDSPRRGVGFVTTKIVNHLARFVAGQPEPLTLGYLDGHRDWGFAGDYVKAMYAMLQLDTPEDIVIGTGETHSVRMFLQMALLSAGIDREEFYRDWLKADSRLVRGNEEKRMWADTGKAKRLLNWQATTTFRELVEGMVHGVLIQR